LAQSAGHAAAAAAVQAGSPTAADDAPMDERDGVDAVDVPEKILDHDWGKGKKRENLRFLIQWRDTPAFRARWEKSKTLFATWDTPTSWQPWTALTDKGATNAVVDSYLKTLRDPSQRFDIERKMGLI